MGTPIDLTVTRGDQNLGAIPLLPNGHQVHCKTTHYLDANIFLTQTWPPSYELVSSRETTDRQKDFTHVDYHSKEVSIFIGHVESGEANPDN